MPDIDLFDPESWCALSFHDQRAALAGAILEALQDTGAVRDVRIEAGSLGREYDFTVAVETDAGLMRSPLWSHGRAMIFCDASVHPANRRQLAPGIAVAEAIDRLRRRIAVPFALESRGLSVTLRPEDGVERVWTAERSLFRNRTAVTREDRVENAAADIDLRDLLAHFYTGPSLRLVSESGEAFILPGAAEAEGPLVSLCHGCGRWSEGAHATCSECGGPADVVVAARPSRR